MKSVLKSAAETPAEPATGPNNVAEHPRVSQALRRVKTVDFTEAEATRIRTLPLSKSWLSDTVLNACDEDESQGSLPAKSRCAVRGEPSFSRPGPKGRLVVPAVTKTEVHVITLAPTCELEVLPHELDIATANPTTQNVQPPDNSYAVVREDIPAEGKQEFPSQDSVTFLALRTPSPVTKCDLEGVNSKVSEWDWGQDLDSESSAPQIIIFPDDEGHAHAVTSMTDVEGDAAKRVPPNSQKTSSALSCPPSTPAIARPSRPPSHDKPGSVGKLRANSRKNSDEDTVLDVPISKAKLTISTTSSNKSKKPLADRRLSNVDDFEVKFRGHRDSVTMARSRLLAHRRVSPEVLEFSTTAKKRMHANNRGISEEEIANTNIASRELFRSHEFATLASSSPTARLGSSSPILSHNSGVLWGFKRSSVSQQIVGFKPDPIFAPENASDFWSIETQQAWLDIVPEGLGYVEVKEPSRYSNLPKPIHDYANQTVFTTSMTHQLHCLYTMLEAYNTLQVSVALGFRNQIKMPWHINHCFEYIRQAIMCAGDVALEGAATTFPGDPVSGEDLGGSDGWDAKHVCKDFGQVYAYLEERTVNHVKWIKSDE
ncbi:hypothetical protein SLS60_011500 [Paraconiothyrium brasiliense]|uniref:Uncharacterized protein n=1 Tax=Paraconiothyrium brasiliense TaxID=300254 RepID=A0ABR3QIE3_9PLEO